jgi:hypothetical protein
MINNTINIYKNKLKSNIGNMIEQDININQSVKDAIASRTGGFRSMHANQLRKLNPINSAFQTIGDPTSGDTVGR